MFLSVVVVVVAVVVVVVVVVVVAPFLSSYFHMRLLSKEHHFSYFQTVANESPVFFAPKL